MRWGVAGVHDDFDGGNLLPIRKAFGLPFHQGGPDAEGGEFSVGKQVRGHEPGHGAWPDFGFVVGKFAVLVRLAFASEVDDVPRAAFGDAAAAACAAGGLEGDDGAVEGLGEFNADAGEHAGALDGIHRQVEVGGGEWRFFLEGGVKH